MAVGADISPRYQDGINWSQIDNSDDPNRGMRFCWVKVSDGGAPYRFNNLSPDAQYAGARSRGIPVGGYHYAQLSPSAEAQAATFVGELRRLGAQGLTPMLDLEAPFEPNNTAKAFGIRFCTEVQRLGFRPAVYMSAAFAKVLRPDTWAISGLVIVIARYGNKPEAPGSAQYLGRYDVHQFSDSGTRGSKNVDLDESYTNNHFGAQGAPGMGTTQDRQVAETRAQLTGSETPNAYPGFVSLVPGSTFHATVTDYIRYIDYRTYNMEQTALPGLNTKVDAVIAGFNALGAQLAVVFTTINDKLDQILENQGSTVAASAGEELRAAVSSLQELCGSVDEAPEATLPEDDHPATELGQAQDEVSE
jgi:GH25 family lysozyme M1 (1,4-beta-N-acetylmuramidase)